jgi:hypothetical protein
LSGEFILINKAKQEQEKASEGKIGKSHAHKKEKKYCEGAEKATRGGGKHFLLVACAFFSFTLVQSPRLLLLKALADAGRASSGARLHLLDSEER